MTFSDPLREGTSPTTDGVQRDPSTEHHVVDFPAERSVDTPTRVLDILAEVVFRTDPAGNWTFLNPAWTDLTGFPVESSLGTNFLDYVHPDERDHTIALFQAVVAGGADHCHHRTRYRTADGSYRWIELRARLHLDEQGQLLGNSGVLLDLTERRQAEESVTEHGRLLELIADGAEFDDLPVGIAVYGADLTLRRVSPVLRRLLGPALDLGSPIGALYEALKSSDSDGVALDGTYGLVETALRTSRPQYGDLRLLSSSRDRRLSFHVSLFPRSDRDAPKDALALVVHDVTDVRRAERQSAAIAALGQRALAGIEESALLEEATHTVTATLGVPRCVILELIEGEVGLFPRAATGWPNGPHSIGLIPADPALLRDAPSGGSAPYRSDSWLSEHGIVSSISVPIRGRGILFGVLTAGTNNERQFAADETDFLQSVANVLGAAIDRHLAEEGTRYQALHDPLTGLANRVLLDDRLSQALRTRRRAGGQSALLLMDLDRFKEINDSLGHPVGDRVLRLVGARLQEATRDTDTVARLGGDEFAVVLPDVTTPSDAHEIAASLRSRVASINEVSGVPLHVEGTVGIALAPQHGDDPVTLLKRADVAMYHAKQTSAGIATYSQESDHNSPESVAYSAALRTAIDNDQLVLHYQPIVDLKTGRMTAAEALVRWQHPSFGLIAPSKFIPLAERTGLIKPLTRRVLAMALEQGRRWSEQGSALQVSVNLSARMLNDGELISLVGEALAAAGLPPALLQLELTESAVIASPDAALAMMTRLRETGVRISLDDFGTGYSSLTYLRRLPVHQVKIDRSFIHDIAWNRVDSSIVGCVIDLAHNLGLRALSEGIETNEALQQLKRLGCDDGQGFFIGRPVPAAHLAPATTTFTGR